jgi:signal transduction histidine kinase
MTVAHGLRTWITTPKHRTRLAWAWLTVVVLFTAELALFLRLNHAAYGPGDSTGTWFLAIAAPVWALVGAVIVSRTGNLVGWILLAVATVMVASPAAEQYILYGTVTHPGSLPLLAVAARVGTTTMALLWGIGLLFLVFPTGRPLSPRWRPVVWAFAVGALLHALGWQVRLDDAGRRAFPGQWETRGIIIPNSLATPALNAVWQIGVAIALTASALSIVSLVLRFRRASGEERAQLRWFSLIGIVIVLAFVVGLAIPAFRGGELLFLVMFFSLVFGIPAACAIAILKYRLYEIDVVISKALVFGGLTLFIAVVYVSLVVGVGAIVGGADNLALSIGATAVVAVLFEPVRARVHRGANRLVYGERATPYEVMAGFSARVSDTVSIDDVLPGMAAAAGSGVGAGDVAVRVFLPDGGERVERWERGDRRVRADAARFPVRYRGEAIGEIDVRKPVDEPMRDAERALLEDLAGQAGLAMHNVRLTEELAIRLRELDEQAAAIRASRERLVTARDAQRRGLQRDLHEGPEQQLIRIGEAVVVARSPGDLDPLLEDANEALEGLRDLARGIFPPLLADKGIEAALEAHIRKVGASARVEATPSATGRRFDADTEACVYFCCLQAIQNVLRHGGNAPTVVHLAIDGDRLTFEIVDDGPGFDVALTPRGMGIEIMQDRVDALEGTLDVWSTPGNGTTIAIAIPARAEALA